MNNRVSEQKLNDGGYHVKRLVNEANARLKQIGKQGKRATIVAKTTSLALQFTFKDGNGIAQKQVGLGAIVLNQKGIAKAEEIAQLVTGQLVAGTFNWDWFNALIGKDTSEKTQVLTCKQMVEQFKPHFFKQRVGNKANGKSWYERCRRLEEVLGNLDKPISLALIRSVIELTENNTPNRGRTISGVVEFLRYHDNSDYKKVIQEYKKNNNPEPREGDPPSDEKIIEIYKTGFIPCPTNRKKYGHRYGQWQFLYGLLATYGLRIHEAWNIANWDKPAIFKDGDWVTMDVADEATISALRDAGETIIAAILDPSNTKHFLCIKRNTKTGYREVFPLSPEGHNWIEEFDLLQPFNIPDIERPLERGGQALGALRCSDKTTKWFKKKKYGFTPHELRHAYNHRGHRQGINTDALCQSLGHGRQMNLTTYRNSKSKKVKLQDLELAVSKQQQKHSENELLKNKVKDLKAQVQAQENEIELLKTKLKMYEAIAESKNQK